MKRFCSATLKLLNVPAFRAATALSVGTNIVYGPFPVICEATPVETSHEPKVEAPEMFSAIETTFDDTRSTVFIETFAVSEVSITALPSDERSAGTSLLDEYSEYNPNP